MESAELRVAICDDEPAVRENLKGLVSRWAEAAGHLISMEEFPSAEAFLFHYGECKDYDILLLDIEMCGMNGVELAKSVRVDNQEVQIVFITGYMDYIADGYEVEALHYLMKPVGFEKLSAVLDRAVEKRRREEKVFLLSEREETIRIPLYEIRYVEVMRNYVTVHAKEAYTIKKSLGEMEKALDNRFFRTGRSYLVNLHAVKKITKKEITLRDGTALPLPRGMYEPLNQAMIHFF